ncbi:MAG: hypothetical protein WCK65_05035 [Rhodospirillaceae bacterium]
MGAVAFDTLKLARKLRDTAHMTQEQAEGIADALAEAMSCAELSTKGDIAEVKAEFKTSLSDTKVEILKWVVGLIGFQTIVILGGVAALIKLLGH